VLIKGAFLEDIPSGSKSKGLIVRVLIFEPFTETFPEKYFHIRAVVSYIGISYLFFPFSM
jgi:hypothetical protein